MTQESAGKSGISEKSGAVERQETGKSSGTCREIGRKPFGLRLGYTTGSCAAAAAKAAAQMLLSGETVEHVRLMTRRGSSLLGFGADFKDRSIRGMRGAQIQRG